MIKIESVIEWSKGDSWNLVSGIRDCLLILLVIGIIICVVIIIASLLPPTSSNWTDIQTLSCFELHDVITESGETEYNYRNVSGSWEKISAVYGAKCK